MFNKLVPEKFPYKPSVRYGAPNFVVNLGPFPVAMISKTMESGARLGWLQSKVRKANKAY